MLKRWIPGVLCLALLWAFPFIVTGQSSDAGLDRVINQIETMFPPVEGYVVAVDGDQVILDLKQGDAIKEGDKLDVVRYGEELVHPVKGKKLGRKESPLGQVRITRISQNFSIALPIKRHVGPKEEIKVGDGVRLPFSKMSILVAPVKTKDASEVDTNQLILDLEKRLKSHRRFKVPAFDLGVWMLDNKVAARDLSQSSTLSQLQKKVEADFILIPTVRTVKNKMVFSYQLLSTEEQKVVKSAEVLSDQLPTKGANRKASRSAGVGQLGRGQEAFEFVAKQEIPFEIVDMAMGDVNGNGQKEYIIIDRYKVNIYKFENNKFRKITHWKGNKGVDNFISVDTADLNGNGIDEIFVTNQSGTYLDSFVLEADRKKKKFVKVWGNQNFYFRRIDPLDGDPLIVAQSPGYTEAFSQGIEIVKFQNSNYKLTGKLPLPTIYDRNFIVYGLTQANLTSQKGLETIILDKDYHLRVYSSSGRLLEKSEDYFGHDPRMINVGEKPQAITGMVQGDTGVHFRGRVQVLRNGRSPFLIVPRNHRLGGGFADKMVIVNNSSLVFLEIAPQGFLNYFETAKQKGYLATFQLTEPLKSKNRLLHVITVDSGGFFDGIKKIKKGGLSISSVFTYLWKPL